MQTISAGASPPADSNRSKVILWQLGSVTTLLAAALALAWWVVFVFYFVPRFADIASDVAVQLPPLVVLVVTLPAWAVAAGAALLLAILVAKECLLFRHPKANTIINSAALVVVLVTAIAAASVLVMMTNRLVASLN